jgi:hypothetical protein
MCGIEMLTGVTKGDVADRPWSVENSLRITTSGIRAAFVVLSLA